MVPVHKRRFCYFHPFSEVGGQDLASIEKSHNDNVMEAPPSIEKQP